MAQYGIEILLLKTNSISRWEGEYGNRINYKQAIRETGSKKHRPELENISVNEQTEKAKTDIFSNVDLRENYIKTGSIQYLQLN